MTAVITRGLDKDSRIEELSSPGFGWIALLVRNLLVVFTLVVVLFDWSLAFALLPRLEEQYLAGDIQIGETAKLAFSPGFRGSIVLFSIVSVGIILVLWKFLDSNGAVVLTTLLVLILASVYAAFMFLSALQPFVPLLNGGI